MKINNIKFTIILLQLLILAGVIACLFMLEIPEGNQEVAYVALGALFNDVAHSINNMFQKKEST